MSKVHAQNTDILPKLQNPFAQETKMEFTVPGQLGYEPGIYEERLQEGYDLIQRPKKAAGLKNVLRQHQKNRMTIWERIDLLNDDDNEATILFQNWGPNLDGASLVTALILSLIHI